MKQNILLEVTMRLVPVPNVILLFPLFTHQYSTVHLPLVHVWPVRSLSTRLASEVTFFGVMIFYF